MILLQTFLFNHVEQFSYQPSVAVSGNLRGKVTVVDKALSSHGHETHLSTSLNGNCTQFEFQTCRNFYVDLREPYLAWKLNFVRGHGYKTYNTKKVKKAAQRRNKAEEETAVEEEQEPPVTLITHVKKKHFALNCFHC